MVDTSTILAFFAGIVVSGLAVLKYFWSHISPDEAAEIYKKAQKAIEDYNTAMEDGSLSQDEKLRIAEDTIEVLQEIVKALEA